MQLRARTRRLPKAGNAAGEYEDACWPEQYEQGTSVFRCAMADGATEASFSGLWAELVVRAYGKGMLGSRRWPSTIAGLQEEWRRQVESKPLPWYAEEKLLDGAFSSLLGLTISSRQPDGLRWHATAVGDTCLMQVRDHSLLTAFPLDDADDFDSRPHLLASNPARNHALTDHLGRRGGVTLPGDTFYLCTDALAAWFLGAAANGASPWAEIGEWMEAPTTEFESRIGALRDDGLLRNDDVTVMMVEVG